MPNVTLFDASYYLLNNPDVVTQISLGVFRSAEDHYARFGAKENRSPNSVFDAKYYAANNADVLNAVSAGRFPSVFDHYKANGLAENRSPNASLAGFNGTDYLARNPDIAPTYTATTAIQHYVLYGNTEGRSFTSSTAGSVIGNVTGTTSDDTVTPAGGQAATVRVEGGQQGAGGDTLVVTSGSASSFQVIDLSNNGGDQNQTRDNQTGTNTGNKVGPVVQGFENVDARQATINMNLTAIDRTSVTNSGGVASTQTGSVLQGGTGRDTLAGNAGNDSIVGNDGNDIITGAAGNDTLSGGVGDDNIDGGTGNDTISDGAGNDTVTGGAGNDTITVDAGTNSIDGGADNDTITLAADQATSTTVSTISGGAGNDTIVLNATAITAASRVSVSGGTGTDTITAGFGIETVNAGAGNDTVKITEANLGASDIFNGNDGQDIIQLEIPTGSGTNTFVFQPGATATGTSRFSGFEAIALIDSSTNATAKSYKINLTDTFVSQNFVNGSFLIDARGLPGGSNLVIDFSGLTAASAARFTASAFRVLTSPTTDVRDQNNVTITAAYSVQTGNPALNNVTGFSVYSGDTTIVAGTEAAYTADRTVNTGTGQATYTNTGGTAETGTGTSGGGNTFTLTANTAILTNSVNVGASPTTGFLTDAGDTVNAAAFLSGNTVLQDNSTSDNDVLNAIVTAQVTPVLQNIETINLSSFGTAGLTLNASTGYNTINLSGTGTATLAGLSNGRTVNLTSASQSAQFDTGTLTDNATNTLTVSLNGIAAGTLAFGTGNNTADFDQVTLTSSGSAANSFTIGAARFDNATTDLLTISGTQNLTMSATAALASGQRINASALATPVFTVAVTDDGAAINLANYVGLDAVNFTNAGGLTGGDDVISGVSTGTVFSLTPTTASTTHGTLTITGGTAAQSGLTDTTGLTLAGTTVGTGALTFTSFETVNLVSSGSAATTVASVTLTDSVVTETLNVSGATNLTITSATSNVINASALTGTFTLGSTTASTIITGSATAVNTITGSTAADTITGGSAADTIANRATGGAASAGDVLTGGAGADTFILRGDTATGAYSTIQATTSRIADFVVGTDILQLSATAGNYANAGTGFNGTVAAAAAGSTVIMSVAQSAGAAAITAGTDLIKLTTGVTTAGTLQAAFDVAIGTSTVTGLTASTEIFFSFYDTTNNRAVIGVVDANGTTNTTVEAGDVVSLVGTINMTAADYATFSAASLSIIAA